ncbi:hypothetical protein [Rhizobium lusitanum]|uniref:hypothetical protein n=1 Tax=Rhizobium lusitanum TaxID=293958 RepID=UPI0019572157|nr:hypothetical protein [Rhizobium lusitanum]MBM7047582.1 hypothetical protein [Rhizobium lusitanum]
MGGKSSTSTTKTELPPQIMAAYQGLINQATPISQTPYQPYSGGVNGSGFEQNQITGFNDIANLAGSSNGAFNNASGALASTATPTSASVGQYMSPYLNSVVQSTMANMNEQNAEQQQGVLGNAAAQGALGGNRVGVAQSELARQQNLANQQTISGLYNQGYNTALGAAQSDKNAALQAGSEYTNLGQTAMQTNLAQAAAQVGAGTQQQQWNYQQYQNQLSYPFETTSWLANIVEGLGSGSGGTTTSTQPSGNTGSAVLGGVLGLASLFNKGGVVSEDDRPHRAQGGIIPYTGSSGIAANNNNPAGANDNGGYVPQVATAGIVPGRSTLPQAPQGGQQQDQGQQMLQQGIKAAETNLKQKYPNGLVAGLSQPSTTSLNAPVSAPVTPAPVPSNPGVLSSLGNFFGFADGGVARRGYDDGGYVDPRVVAVPAVPDASAIDPATISPSQMRAVLDAAAQQAPAPETPQTAGVVPQQRSEQPAAPPLAPPITVRDMPVAGVAPQQDAPSQATSPRQYNIGNAPQMTPNFDKINNSYGLPTGYLNRTAYIESSFNPNANNGISKGEFQFTNATAGQYGLKNPFDPLASADAAARLAVDNQKFLAHGLGREPTAGELYLAHQQGAAGALNLLSHPDAPATDIVGRQAVVGNGGSANMTAQQFANLWTNKFNGMPATSAGYQPTDSGDTSAPSGIAASSQGVAPANNKGVSFSNEASSPGFLGRLFGGHGLGLSDDQRMALLSAGLGMMAGTSPNFATNVGTGGMKGVESYMQKQQLNRENALAQSEIATRSGQLGLEGKRVDIAGQQLALEAKKAASEIGLQTAQTGKTNLETQTGRWQQTVTPAGIIVRDMTDPNAPPKLTTWDDIQKNGPPSAVTGSNEAIGASLASGTSQNAPASASQQQGNAPVKAAPTAPIGAPAQTQEQSSQAQAQGQRQAQPVFTSSAPSRVGIDPRMFSPTGQQIVANETTDALKQAREEYQGATSAQTQLGEMKHDLATIPNSAWTAPGTGFQSRVQWAKTINTAVQAMGMEPPIDETAVAAGEDLNKLTTRLGFDLSKTLGSREAASIVDQSVSAVPGGANSPEGARRVIAGIEAANQRKMDYYNFLQDWSAKTGGSIKGADEYFNKANPPELYALASYVPAGAIAALRQNPQLAPDFDAKYGMGRSVSQYVLGGQ